MENVLDYLGGRKFILSLILISVGTLVELKTDRGVSTAFAGLLVGVLGAFSAANAFVTKSMGAESGDVPPTDIPDLASSQEELKKAVAEIADKVNKAAELTANVGQLVSNQNKILAATLQGKN